MPNNSVSYHDTLDVDMKFKKDYEMCIKTYIAFEKKTNNIYKFLPIHCLHSFIWFYWYFVSVTHFTRKTRIINFVHKNVYINMECWLQCFKSCFDDLYCFWYICMLMNIDCGVVSVNTFNGHGVLAFVAFE